MSNLNNTTKKVINDVLKEDAQAVIDNPNFREILDIIYKD